MISEKVSLQTKVIHEGQKPEAATGSVMTPIYATSTYVQESPGVHSGYEYSRAGNPTRHALEECMAGLEGAQAAFAFASGMAATDAVIGLLDKDSHMISCVDVYGGTYRLFENVKKRSSGLDVTYVDMTDPALIKKAIRPDTKAIWVETPSNPLLNIYDLYEIATIAKEHGILTICDNTFASPILQQPLSLGFDIVVHSGTKYINGHSDVIAGIVAVSDKKLADRIRFIQKSVGAILSPFDSFLVLRGIKTLWLRMMTHCENAVMISGFLSSHKGVKKVIYPGLDSHPGYELAKRQMKGFGGMISVYLDADMEKTVKFLKSLKIFILAESLGGVESLIGHPASMTHASIPPSVRKAHGIHDNLIRLSVGIEDPVDLISDLSQALEGI
jgi:cystathionine gamma-lyase